MSSSKVIRAPALALAAVALLLAGCQVRPLYETPAPVAGRLAAIEISEAGDRVEQAVRNALIFALAGGAGEPANPEYRLALTVSTRTMNVLYDRKSDRAAAGRITVKADFNLTRVSDGRTVVSGSRSSVALVDFPVQEFSKLRAIRDGENRAAREVAEIIRADVASALAR
ncbi:LPS assembly lipoprotein LptE [Ensifer soli]|uniref:LPS assembly lipoprotein LptE n=1 Tax=Ciceribacter sp. sgz301302 TaxID=3342379 RepID=UPI0035B8E2AD